MTRGCLRIALTLALAVATGCESSTPTSPTQAVPTGPAAAGRTYVVAGVVSRSTGDGTLPVEGVKVEVVVGCSPGRCPRFSLTDREGYYRIADVPGGNAVVQVSRWGYASAATAVVLTGDSRIDFQVVRQDSYTLSGVMWELTAVGLTAVENVSVYCDACGELGHTWAFTDDDGAYHFPDVFGGTVAILVQKDGYVASDPVRTLANGMAEFTTRVSGNTHLDVQMIRR